MFLSPFKDFSTIGVEFWAGVGIGVTSFRFRGSCTALKYSTKKDFAGAGLCCRLTLDGEKTMPLWDFLKCSKQLVRLLGARPRENAKNTEGSGWKEPYIFRDNRQPELAVKSWGHHRNVVILDSTAVRISGYIGCTSCFALCLMWGSVLCCCVIIFSLCV